MNPAFINPNQQQLAYVTASTQTGLDNGEYYYRIKNTNGEWSNTVKVVVKHHPLNRAFLFFTLGLGMFLILLATLFVGHRWSGHQQV